MGTKHVVKADLYKSYHQVFYQVQNMLSKQIYTKVIIRVFIRYKLNMLSDQIYTKFNINFFIRYYNMLSIQIKS